MNINPLFLTDAYKLGHSAQYPKGTSTVYSNWTPRSLSHSPIPSRYSDNKIVFVGLQATLISLTALWEDNFFSKDKDTVCTEFVEAILPFVGPSGFDKSKIEALHDYGKLPIIVKALPEGSKVGIKVPMFTIENTKPKFYWVTNYLETVLSADLWKSCTVATIANTYKRILTKYAVETGTDLEFVNFQAHDFSSRGLSGWEDIMRVGFAHLTSFMGTDSIAALPYADEYYGTKGEFKGASVPATEHSVMSLGGEEKEIDTFRRLITETYPAGIISIVSDTWDFWNVVTNYMAELKDEVLARTPDELGNAKVVIRPDSGDPVDILAGTAIAIDNIAWAKSHLSETGSSKIFVINEAYYIAGYTKGKYGYKFFSELFEGEVTPEMKGAVECLYEIYGGTITDRGYKLLDSKVGLIYGDSITMARADMILSRLKTKGFASGNVVLGVGSFSYQFLTRDTFGFAMKSTYGVVNGVGKPIFKKPKTDDGTKHSAKGLLYVGVRNGEYYLEDDVSRELEEASELKTIYKNGKFFIRNTLTSIRKLLS